MKMHFFVSKASDRYALDYILRFKDNVVRTVRLPAPHVFDFSRRNGYLFQWPSLMRSRGDTSFTTPRSGLSQTRRSASCIRPFRRSTWHIHPSRRRPSPTGVKGLPLDGRRDLLLHTRIPGRRCMLPTSPSTHGHTSTTWEQEAPRDRSRRAQLRPKA